MERFRTITWSMNATGRTFADYLNTEVADNENVIDIRHGDMTKDVVLERTPEITVHRDVH